MNNILDIPEFFDHLIFYNIFKEYVKKRMGNNELIMNCKNITFDKLSLLISGL